jgi:nucleotide-binding universal stress UspA family protein
MFRNVLVGVDGSSNGRDGIALASRLLDQSGKLTLAHVSAKQDAAAVKLLEDERAAAGVEAEIVSVRASSPGAGLHQRAEEQAADLLVVGSCGRGAFGRVMIGDDTRAALNGAPCAVAIGARGYSAQPTPIAKIGVADNGSPESGRAREGAGARRSHERHDHRPGSGLDPHVRLRRCGRADARRGH